VGLINFGNQVNSVSAIGGSPDDQVLDLGLYFGSMTLMLKLVGVQASTSGVKVKMETSMNVKLGDWVSLGNFTTVTTASSFDKQTFTNLLRYVRWNVFDLGGATNVTFILSGIARNP